MFEKTLEALKAHWPELQKEGQKLTFRNGQVIFYEGHNAYGIFVIESGKVEFAKGARPCTDDHFWQTPTGEVIGLHHFLADTSYCCTCTALKNCRFVFISKSQLAPYLGR